MKKFLSLLLALTMLLTLCGVASADAGVFTGVGDSEIGGKGAIEVAVTVDENGAVTAIEVTKNADTAGISDPAVAQIPNLIVEQQTANVDAVAGATKTSDAIMAAVLDAVTKAGLDTVKWSTKVETVAENASDGVIAPLFYMMLGGAPLALVYKAINTMDSMVGYKNERYLYFGRAAAKLDDAANYLPARMAALLLAGAAALTGQDARGALRIWRRDRRSHASPNSAQTEAVMAGALGVQLAGPASYFGKLYEKPTIGDALRPVEPGDILRANRMLYAAGTLCMALLACARAAVCLPLGL